MSIRTKSGRAFALSLIILFALLSSIARAAVDLPEELVTASLIRDEEEDKYLSPGMVTVIRPEERKGEQRTLPELLEDVPGLRLIRMRGRYGYSVASIRGSTSSQVAVYVDDVLMNLQSEAAVDLSAISIEEVERIEIYRGYIPAKFGAQAMGGVINIVTKSPESPQTNISLGFGAFGRYKGTVSRSDRLGDGKFFGSFGYETYDGDFGYWSDNGTPYNDADDYTGSRRHNGFSNTDFLLKWENESWRTALSFVRRNRELPGVAPGADKDESAYLGAALDTDRWDFSLARSQTSGSLTWNWNVFYTSQSKEYNNRNIGSTGSIGGIGISHSEYDTTRIGVALDGGIPIGERHFLELRAEYSREQLNVKGDMVNEYFGGIDNYEGVEWNFSVQDTIALDVAGTFLITPSIRWHKLDDDSKLTWQAALTKEFSPNWMIKGTFGTYARAPNMYERFGDSAFILPPVGDLKWEEGKQFDVGVVWNGIIKPFGDARANMSFSGFMRETDDLIEFFMENPRYARYHNISKAEVKGVEIEGNLDWEKWGFSFSATWMDAVNKTPDDPNSFRFDGKKLPNRPDWSAAARLTRKFNKGYAFAEYQYIGENYADASEKVVFDPRHVFNFGVAYDLSATTRITAGVNDIFDSAYDWQMNPDKGTEGPSRMLWHPVEGRSYYLTLNMKF